MMKPVFLIGYMGCGKTTLGDALARLMGVHYIDLDDYIEAPQKKKITEIFDEMGENRFRELETEALLDVARMTDVIVGCGGGTPCHGDNMALMNRVGTTVWLTTSPERITARLMLPDQKSKRPKIACLPDKAILDIVKKELNDRSSFYSQAQLQFDSTDIETAEDTDRTACRLATLLRANC